MCVSGSTAERVCLAGDSAGGNLCITVSMKAMSSGIRVADGIMAAYPATLLTTDASPSRLLTLIDPLLPLGVLTKCINAYAGMWVGACTALAVCCFTPHLTWEHFPAPLEQKTESQRDLCVNRITWEERKMIMIKHLLSCTLSNQQSLLLYI